MLSKFSKRQLSTYALPAQNNLQLIKTSICCDTKTRYVPKMSCATKNRVHIQKSCYIAIYLIKKAHTVYVRSRVQYFLRMARMCPVPRVCQFLLIWSVIRLKSKSTLCLMWVFKINSSMVYFLFPVTGKGTFPLSVEGLPSVIMDSFLLFSNYFISGVNICPDSVAVRTSACVIWQINWSPALFMLLSHFLKCLH